jgi:hypothetical protein
MEPLGRSALSRRSPGHRGCAVPRNKASSWSYLTRVSGSVVLKSIAMDAQGVLGEHGGFSSFVQKMCKSSRAMASLFVVAGRQIMYGLAFGGEESVEQELRSADSRILRSRSDSADTRASMKSGAREKLRWRRYILLHCFRANVL